MFMSMIETSAGSPLSTLDAHHFPGAGVLNFLFSRDPRFVDDVDDGCCGPRSRAGFRAAVLGVRNGRTEGIGLSPLAGHEPEAGPSANEYQQVRLRFRVWKPGHGSRASFVLTRVW